MSDCVCLYNAGDACDACEVARSTIRTARKEHRCFECREPILPGQRYEFTSGIFDGDPFSQKICLPCVEIGQALYCDGRMFGMLWEDIEEQIFHERLMNAACLDKLSTLEAKEFLQRRWWAWVEKHGRDE
jgi:hypothetical protein